MNEYDSEVMAGLLHQKGFCLTSQIEKADFIIINTCYVREKVKHKIYSFLGELKKLKQQNPQLLLGVGGCLAQKEPGEIRRRAPYVDIVWGALNLHRLPEFLEITRRKKTTLIKVEPEGVIPEGLPVVRKRNFSVYIPVIRGCNNFCAYCNVPYVRGRERSRPPDSIVQEVKKAAEEGCKEVILLGQNVNSYGKDLPEAVDFADILYKVSQVEGIIRIRFTTSHPKDLSEKLILALAKLDKVCEHLHLPLQAGSNRILKKMGRGYTKENYLDLVSKLRSLIPGLSLTTDIIVGFPGETEEDFNETLELLRMVRFDGAFTFEYSPLPGTRASEFNHQVPSLVKRERLRQLIDLQRQITEEKNLLWVGREVEVLVEGVSEKNSRELQGRTRENKVVVFPADEDLRGELIRVKIKAAGCWALRGEMIEC
jgi:tRNA-2-methylthio-N6-dimethylallyladenosine synthase